MRILITGGSGFIGHHVVEHFSNHDITILDRLDTSGNQNRLDDIDFRGRFIFHDLKAEINEHLAKQIGPQDVIIHIAAGTHVDRSITNPMSFVMDNVVGTCNLLEYARKYGCEKFVYFSTDEVFGPAPVGYEFKEWDRYKSSNPYSASKAGAEELCIAYHNTYSTPVIITHCMNVFGERQHPEKFIPIVIRKILAGERIQIHGNGVFASSRYYIHAENVARAVDFLLSEGQVGEKYNIVGEREVPNDELVEMVSKIMEMPADYEIVDCDEQRPGHDMRYALDGTRLQEMGFEHTIPLQEGLEQTIRFSLAYPQWL